MSSVHPLPDTDEYNAEIREVFVVKDGVPFVDPAFYTQLIVDAMCASAGPAAFAVRMISLMTLVREMSERAMELSLRDDVLKGLEDMLTETPDDPQSENCSEMTRIGTVLNGYTVIAVASLFVRDDVAVIATRVIHGQSEYVVSAMENGASNWHQGFYTTDFERAWAKFADMVLN